MRWLITILVVAIAVPVFADSIWVRIPPPVVKPPEIIEVRKTCLHCGSCNPKSAEYFSITAMWGECVNTITQSFQCRNTKDWFSVSYGECSTLLWGKWIDDKSN